MTDQRVEIIKVDICIRAVLNRREPFINIKGTFHLLICSDDNFEYILKHTKPNRSFMVIKSPYNILNALQRFAKRLKVDRSKVQ